ncbi:MAG: hypothetical protein ABSF44_00160 [Candidatus Bathyarchaeia archaeon]|jgi:hypothetical protein
MSRTKNRRIVKILIAVVIIGAVASSIIIAYNWQSIFSSKYPIALSNIIFSTDKQIESVSIGIKTYQANEPIITNSIAINTTGLEPLATPQNIPQGGKYATSDYITPTKYSIGQTIVIDRISNISHIHERLTIMITSKMLQYTAGYHVNMQSTHIGYAIAIPINATWVSIAE